MTAVLEMVGVTVTRAQHRVLCGIDLRVEAGQVVALVGPSGSGKSTVLRALLGLVDIDAGSIFIRGQRANGPGHAPMVARRRGLAVVFQDLALWPHLTVANNLRFVLGTHNMTRADVAARIGSMLERVGLADKANRYPGELSGGERQRVAIARALVVAPSALLLDEPLSNLDVALRWELMELLDSLRDDDTAVLYVTHFPLEVARLAHLCVVLEDGRVVQRGTVAALRAHPANEFVRRMFAMS
ncbi:MAG TPA: ATP-binding cassette domain-containing protein [Sorangium sp.]|nr:ATP-binding cassette domain-containing protein [Sorangium sp.]